MALSIEAIKRPFQSVLAMIKYKKKIIFKVNRCVPPQPEALCKSARCVARLTLPPLLRLLCHREVGFTWDPAEHSHLAK